MADQAATEKAATEKAAADQADQAATEKAATEKVAADQVVADQAATDKAAAEKAAGEKAAADKATCTVEKAGADQTAADEAASWSAQENKENEDAQQAVDAELNEKIRLMEQFMLEPDYTQEEADNIRGLIAKYVQRAGLERPEADLHLGGQRPPPGRLQLVCHVLSGDQGHGSRWDVEHRVRAEARREQH